MTLAELITEIERKREIAQAEIDKFTGRLATNHVYAFEWAVGAMYGAAYLDVTNWCLAYLKRDTPDDAEKMENIKEHVTRELLVAAMSANNHSNSATRNIMQDNRLAVLADLLDTLKW